VGAGSRRRCQLRSRVATVSYSFYWKLQQQQQQQQQKENLDWNSDWINLIALEKKNVGKSSVDRLEIALKLL